MSWYKNSIFRNGHNCSSRASNSGDQQQQRKAGGEVVSLTEADQWESKTKRTIIAAVASSMPAGDLLQRVSKLVNPAGASSSSSCSSKHEDDNKSTPVEPVLDEDVASAPRRQSSRDRHSESAVDMKRSSSELERLPSLSKSTSTYADNKMEEESSSSKAKKKAPNPIKTSQLSAGQPMLSFTPATPISPASPSPPQSSTTTLKKKPSSARKDGSDNVGGNTEKAAIRFSKRSASPASTSSPSNLSKSQSMDSDKVDDGHPEAEEGEEEDPRSNTVILTASQNRNSSLQTGSAAEQHKEDQDNSDDSAIVLEEPAQMSEEEEQRLMDIMNQKRDQASTQSSTSSSDKKTSNNSNTGVHNQNQSQSISNNNSRDDHPERQDEVIGSADLDKETNAQAALSASSSREGDMASYTQSPDAVEEDRPSMPPPRLPQAPTTTARQFPPPKPSILHRLPSQVISESPGSEYPPTPSTSGGLSRQPSLRRGDTAGSGFTDLSENATFAFSNVERGQSKSDDVDDDSENKGGQSHMPSMLATAVQNLHHKINKPTSDYGFPSQALKEAPPATISEEDCPPLPQVDSPISEKDDPISASPPSTSFLDPTSHLSRFARDSPTSSVQSGSSVNEYSTPAGFMKHRRNSSQNAPREVKETTNAGYKDLPDGKRKLNNYILTSDIGRGSFGLVQIAKDEETGQEFAAKEFSKMRLKKRQQSEMIRRQAKGSRRGAVPMRARTSAPERKSPDPGDPGKNDLDLIRSEVAIMKKLDHPNVVRLYEVLDVQQDDSLFMIVELCRNGPIMNVSMGQATEPMSEDTARNFFRQMILAIEYLHENGIIHRDIKPENILKMSDDQSIKLVDFGVSEMFSKEDEERELRTGGSPAFMAPELCMSGHAKVSGKATDIWALGVTLYCMVVGHLPFESHLLLDLYDKIKTDPVNMPEHLSTDLKDLIVCLLEKDPHKRIRMDKLREHPWVTCAGRDPLPSTAQNVTSVEEVTEDDLAKAIAVPSVSYIINAVRAASRWKRFTARRTQSDSAQSDGGSTASTDMSRSGSLDVMEALASASRRGSNGKESNSGHTPLSQATSPPDEKSNSGTAPEQSPASTSNRLKNDTEAVHQRNAHQRSDSESSQSTTNSQKQSTAISGSASSIKPAMSFPQSTKGGKEKCTELASVAAAATAADAANSSSPQASVKSIDAMVDFPEIDRSLSHQEHMSIHGIDDSSVEVLRHYEDTTGHMLPRSAIEETVRSRKASPMPPSRQTAAGPSPP